MYLIHQITQINVPHLFLSRVVLFDASASYRFSIDDLEEIARYTFGTLIIATTNASRAPLTSTPGALLPLRLEDYACV